MADTTGGAGQRRRMVAALRKRGAEAARACAVGHIAISELRNAGGRFDS